MRASLLAQSIPDRNESIDSNHGNKTHSKRTLAQLEIAKFANWSFASRNLLWHPPQETSVLLPNNHVGYREEDHTNGCNRKLSVDVTWRLREDYSGHLAVSVNGRNYQIDPSNPSLWLKVWHLIQSVSSEKPSHLGQSTFFVVFCTSFQFTQPLQPMRLIRRRIRLFRPTDPARIRDSRCSNRFLTLVLCPKQLQPCRFY